MARRRQEDNFLVRRDRVKQVLGDPDLFPDEFRSWLVRYLEINPPRFLYSDLTGSVSGRRIGWNTGTTAPANPGNKDLWLYPADATNGVYWPFFYDSGSAHASKWTALGAQSPLWAEDAAESVGFGAATGVCSITLALAGDYVAHASTHCTIGPGANEAGELWVSDDGADTKKVGTLFSSTAFIIESSIAGEVRVNGIAAGSVMTARLKSNGSGGTVDFNETYLSLRPIRVSG